MERLMQFIWQHRLWDDGNLATSSGSRVRIIHPGVLNSDAGPDFFNAAVEIDGQRWSGNVEIHVRASDWFRHGHDRYRAYDSVILHVVRDDDAEVRRPDGSVIPQIAVRCPADTAARCNALMMASHCSLPCAATIKELPRIFHTEWLTALALERLYMKSERILDLVKFTEGDWEAAAYITLARALGFGLNAEPFETLAKNLPLKFLNRHRDELLTMEALIFGQAGLIPAPAPGEDAYVTRTRQEYLFMARKFSLTPLPLQWKMARTRPQNFPHRRLALLARKIHCGFSLIGRLDDIVTEFRALRETNFHDTRVYYGHIREPELPLYPSLESVRHDFDLPLTGFWATRFTFGPGHGATPKVLSAASVDRLMINVVLPLMLARATARGDVATMEIIPELLRTLPAEDNRDVRLFAGAGLSCADAFDTQAVIQLRREYCERNKCIYCRFGHRMFSAEIRR